MQQRPISFWRFKEGLEAGGVEASDERLWRLYFALDWTTEEVIANAIESALLRPERERTDG